MADAGPKEGKKAPAFRGTANGGDAVALKDYAGQTLVFFWYPKAMTPG